MRSTTTIIAIILLSLFFTGCFEIENPVNQATFAHGATIHFSVDTTNADNVVWTTSYVNEGGQNITTEIGRGGSFDYSGLPTVNGQITTHIITAYKSNKPDTRDTSTIFIKPRCLYEELSDCSYLNGICLQGFCDPTTDECVSIQAADGASCDDDDVCTETDSCLSGVCKGVVTNICDPQSDYNGWISINNGTLNQEPAFSYKENKDTLGNMESIDITFESKGLSYSVVHTTDRTNLSMRIPSVDAKHFKDEFPAMPSLARYLEGDCTWDQLNINVVAEEYLEIGEVDIASTFINGSDALLSEQDAFVSFPSNHYSISSSTIAAGKLQNAFGVEVNPVRLIQKTANIYGVQILAKLKVVVSPQTYRACNEDGLDNFAALRRMLISNYDEMKLATQVNSIHFENLVIIIDNALYYLYGDASHEIRSDLADILDNFIQLKSSQGINTIVRSVRDLTSSANSVYDDEQACRILQGILDIEQANFAKRNAVLLISSNDGNPVNLSLFHSGLYSLRTLPQACNDYLVEEYNGCDRGMLLCGEYSKNYRVCEYNFPGYWDYSSQISSVPNGYKCVFGTIWRTNSLGTANREFEETLAYQPAVLTEEMFQRSIGIMPARNIADIRNQFAKIIDYSTNTQNAKYSKQLFLTQFEENTHWDKSFDYLTFNVLGRAKKSMIGRPIFENSNDEKDLLFDAPDNAGAIFTPYMRSSSDYFDSYNSIDSSNIVNEVNKGYGAIFYNGHGSWQGWPNTLSSEYPNLDSINRLNGDTYPIVISDSCATIDFGTDFIGYGTDITSFGPEMMFHPFGATMYVGVLRGKGSLLSAAQYGMDENDDVALYDFILSNSLEAISTSGGKLTAGEFHTYLLTQDPGYPDYPIVLLGDPTMQIRGFDNPNTDMDQKPNYFDLCPTEYNINEVCDQENRDKQIELCKNRLTMQRTYAFCNQNSNLADAVVCDDVRHIVECEAENCNMDLFAYYCKGLVTDVPCDTALETTVIASAYTAIESIELASYHCDPIKSMSMSRERGFGDFTVGKQVNMQTQPLSAPLAKPADNAELDQHYCVCEYENNTNCTTRCTTLPYRFEEEINNIVDSKGWQHLFQWERNGNVCAGTEPVALQRNICNEPNTSTQSFSACENLPNQNFFPGAYDNSLFLVPYTPGAPYFNTQSWKWGSELLPNDFSDAIDCLIPEAVFSGGEYEFRTILHTMPIHDSEGFTGTHWFSSYEKIRKFNLITSEDPPEVSLPGSGLIEFPKEMLTPYPWPLPFGIPDWFENNVVFDSPGYMISRYDGSQEWVEGRESGIFMVNILDTEEMLQTLSVVSFGRMLGLDGTTPVLPMAFDSFTTISIVDPQNGLPAWLLIDQSSVGSYANAFIIRIDLALSNYANKASLPLMMDFIGKIPNGHDQYRYDYTANKLWRITIDEESGKLSLYYARIQENSPLIFQRYISRALQQSLVDFDDYSVAVSYGNHFSLYLYSENSNVVYTYSAANDELLPQNIEAPASCASYSEGVLRLYSMNDQGGTMTQISPYGVSTYLCNSSSCPATGAGCTIMPVTYDNQVYVVSPRETYYTIGSYVYSPYPPSTPGAKSTSEQQSMVGKAVTGGFLAEE